MTTIAYRDGIMASDSRCTTDEYMHLTECQKIFRMSSGALLGTAGDDDARSLLALLDGVGHGSGLPSRKDLGETETDFLGLLALPDGTLWRIEIEHVNDSHWTGAVSELSSEFAAVGSGAAFAYGAMGHGATAAEAVAVACRFDVFSQLPLQEERLLEGIPSTSKNSSKKPTGKASARQPKKK